MGVILKLDPENALNSIAVRLARIASDEAYVREVYARYEGLKTFEMALAERGLVSRVAQIVKE